MEPLQKLHWFGILTAFLPFLMFTSAQITSPHYDFHMRENLSPVFYNPSKTNPLSDQMGKLQRIAEAQPEAEATAVANPNAKAEADYRGKRSAVAEADPNAEAEAYGRYGYGGYGYGGYGGYRGYGGYGYGGYRGKRSAIAEADPNAEAEAYGYGYGRGYGYGGYGGYRGGYGGYGYGGYRGKRSAVKPGSFGHPFYSSYGHQLQWPSFRAPGFQKTVQKTAGPGGAPLRRLEAEASAQPDADAYYGYGGYGYGGYRGKRSAPVVAPYAYGQAVAYGAYPYGQSAYGAYHNISGDGHIASSHQHVSTPAAIYGISALHKR